MFFVQKLLVIFIVFTILIISLFSCAPQPIIQATKLSNTTVTLPPAFTRTPILLTAEPTSTPTPTRIATATPCFDVIASPLATPVLWYGSQPLNPKYSRIPVNQAICASKEEIVRKLIIQFYDHYEVDNGTKLEFMINDINVIKSYQLPWSMEVKNNEIVASVSIRVKGNYFASSNPKILPGGWEILSGFFGVYREGDYFRLITL